MSTRIHLAALAAIAALSTSVHAAPPARDWTPVAQALGKAGAVQADGGYRVPLPRTDLHVVLDGVPLKAGFALGSWVAFAPMGKETMVMGDLVLTQDEVSPVMKSLEESGFQITALHNHLLRAEPMTLYMHVMGEGDPVKLAQTLHAARDAVLQDPAVHLALDADYLVDGGCIDAELGGRRRCGGRCERRLAERQRRVEGLGQLHRIALAHHMHVERHGFCAEQVIVQSGDLKAALFQLLHHRTDLVLGQDQIAHDHGLVAHRVERDPGPQGEAGLEGDAI